MKIDKTKLFTEFFDKCPNNINSRKIKHLVLHHIADKSFEDAIKALIDNKVSAHYIIDSDGKIYQLVEECNVAYHAGVSYWRGQDGLNKTSIGIEFYNPKPFEQNFTDAQIKSGIILCQDIIKRHNIAPENIVGHNEIAYFPDNEENRINGIVGKLGRKQDPSPLFPWEEFVKNGVGVQDNSKITQIKNLIGSKSTALLKQNLKNHGYKVNDVDDIFDNHLKSLISVFKNRYNKIC